MSLLYHMFLVYIEFMLTDLAILMPRNWKGYFAIVIMVMLYLQALLVEVHLTLR